MIGRIAILVFVLAFYGCGSKNIYKPEQTEGTVSFDGKLPAKIVDVVADGATLANGQIITKNNGILDIKLPQGYRFFSDVDGVITAGDSTGNIAIINKDGTIIKQTKLDSKAATASYKSGKTAVILVDNTAMLYDNDFNPVFMKKNLDPIGVDAKITPPVFLGDLVIFPTLDGKLQIVDQSKGQLIRDIVISDEKHFNNVIFFDVIDDRLIAATQTKVMSISPKFMSTYNAEVADVIFIGKAVYIFTQDGRVVLTTPDLKVQKEQKFKFARFAGEIYGKYVYAVERQGYLIAVDKDLRTSNVFKFNESFTGYFTNAMDHLIFTGNDTIYYGDKYYKLAK